ncbi:hypothetical protein TI39_contig520g00005 [Zymoseptoria brevis]|uniref:RRM domain-containing protein n=1 Tax=Zymoseptoria brevis TaxID=1047168 RepID=A0A0F4GIH3_9PEZI|nr:hypothetical protein TI39_contig520g00005 [Zymoseptoria brevis]
MSKSEMSSSSSSSPEPEQKKRKRTSAPKNDVDELEIDVSLPEPPSKKAKRKEKKQSKSKAPKTESVNTAEGTNETEDATPKVVVKSATSTEPAKRSENGIWIGNLPYSVNRESLQEFLLNAGGIGSTDIMRINMPLNERKQNKGFAYVDFTSPAVLEIALALSEKLVNGRACLIKNANSFEGRPKVSTEAKAADAAAKAAGKEPTKRVFVGNLGFEATRDEINEHFSQAGQVDDVFLATFEDSGKCKGFGWVTFADIESASQAVRGFIWKKQEEEDGDDDAGSHVENDSDEEDNKPKRKPKKPMKWFINRIHGRELRCEFAEDKQTRYKKRYGKAPPAATEQRGGASRYNEATAGEARRGEENLQDLLREAQDAAPKRRDPKMKKMNKDERQDIRRQKFDARKIAPGKALVNAERSSKASGAIPKTSGTKKTFD